MLVKSSTKKGKEILFVYFRLLRMIADTTTIMTSAVTSDSKRLEALTSEFSGCV
jgi:hypothetical protein